MLDHEGHENAEEHQPEAQLPQALAEHAPGDLREPVVDRGEDREHGAAHQHEVEVGDDEVGVVDLPVDRERRHEDAGDPPDQEQRDEADAEDQRRRELDRPAPQRGDPVEDLHAGGTAIRYELNMTKHEIASGIGAVNMWWAQVRKPRKAIATVDAAIDL